MQYNGDKFYVVVTEDSFDITGTSLKIPAQTTVAFSIISQLATALIKKRTSLEDLASLIWSESRTPSDLAGTISTSIEREIAASNKK